MSYMTNNNCWWSFKGEHVSKYMTTKSHSLQERVHLLLLHSCHFYLKRRKWLCLCKPNKTQSHKLEIVEHKAAIRNSNMDYAIVGHYKEKNHRSATSLKFIGIERVRHHPRGDHLINQLFRREVFWIFRLNTIEPYGFKEAQDLSYFLWHENITFISLHR